MYNDKHYKFVFLTLVCSLAADEKIGNLQHVASVNVPVLLEF